MESKTPRKLSAEQYTEEQVLEEFANSQIIKNDENSEFIKNLNVMIFGVVLMVLSAAFIVIGRLTMKKLPDKYRR